MPLNVFIIKREIMGLIQFTKSTKKQHQPKVSGRKGWIKIKAEINTLDNGEGIKLIDRAGEL
jgi:hypothetical protein